MPGSVVHRSLLQAERRAVELLAEAAGARTEIEREALEAVYAYDRVLRSLNKASPGAVRTKQMIDRHGVVATIERLVSKKAESPGYMKLVELGMQDLAFEQIVLRYPEAFSAKAVAMSRQRIQQLEACERVPRV